MYQLVPSLPFERLFKVVSVSEKKSSVHWNNEKRTLLLVWAVEDETVEDVERELEDEEDVLRLLF